MHYFIFPTADTWISSGSSHIDGTDFKDQNFGKDQVLEIKKEFWNKAFDYPTRTLITFAGEGFTEMSQSIVDGDIPTDAKFYLRMFEAQGNTDMSLEYTLGIQPISQSWIEGTGKYLDDPKTTNGVSWDNRSYPDGGSETEWVTKGGAIYYKPSSVLVLSGSTQAFSNESPDVNVEVTDMVNMWLKGQENNNGMLIRFNAGSETDDSTFGKLKFFGKDTHTIYAPRLEVRWDGHKPVTGSNTGSLTQLDVSGQVDNHIYTIAWNDKYRETDKPKFRIGARKQFIQKSFSTSYNTISGSFIPEGSGSYAIVDVATGEKVIDFSDNSKLSCDSKSNYFIEYMNGLFPDRTYKVLIKVKYNDGQERIYDNDFEFKLVR
tara:strand:+ start:6573 stop:7697 length:1125 start_codon:yes stop_codon:yes gene_type:complete